ncbi:MAG: MarC family protein [Dehalococcoidia bacterium]|nr:MarC family protein [Dehalococcoidia bacterium]
MRVADFLLAGGLVLLALSVKDLVTGKLFETTAGSGGETAGVVPLGTPLVVGPAVLTTLLLLIDQYHALLVVLAFMLNLAFAWLVFNQSDRIARFLGKGGVAATAKIASLLLAAIAVKMIRRGILGG